MQKRLLGWGIVENVWGARQRFAMVLRLSGIERRLEKGRLMGGRLGVGVGNGYVQFFNYRFLLFIGIEKIYWIINQFFFLFY